MSFTGPIAASTVLLTAAVAAALTVVAYIIKMRRRRFEVPFSNLWQRVLEQRDANALWKQLKRWLSLLLLLFILGLVALAAFGPTLGDRDPRARSVVILLDASASMKAQDGDPARKGLTRMERAKERAKALIDAMGGGDLAMVVRVDGQATPMSRFDGDKPMLRKVVDGISASDTPADLPRALAAAADALRGRQNPLVVIVSDGAYSDQALGQVLWGEPPAEAAADAGAPTTIGGDGAGSAGSPTTGGDAPAADAVASADLARVDLRGLDVRYLGVGTRAENVGIVAFNVRRYIANKASYEVFIEVQNFGSEPARRQLALYNGETAIEVKPLELAPGQRVREIYRELPGGESTLRASLRPGEGPGADTSDPFPLDDQAWALLPARKKQSVLLVTRDNLYLEGAMLVYDNIEVYKATPAEYDADPARTIHNADTGRPFDAVVFDDHTPAVTPPSPVHLLYFNPAGEHSPFAIRGPVPRPRVTETADEHPVMRWVQLSDVNFDTASAFAADRARGDVVLARYVRDGIAVARREARRKIVAFGWSLAGTDLTLRVAFPLLLVNTLDWFAGDDADLVTTYTTGQRFHIPLDGLLDVREVTVVDPAGVTTPAPVVDSKATFYGRRVGLHQIIAYPPDQPAPPAGAPDLREPLAAFELAANLGSPTESSIAPAQDLVLGGRTLAAPESFPVSARRELWVYLVLAVLALLALEWVTYHRRITV